MPQPAGAGSRSPVQSNSAVIGRTLGAIGIDEIDQAAADPKDRGRVDGLGAHLAIIRLRAALQRMGKGMFGIDNPPGHRGRARAVQIDEASAKTLAVGVEDVIDASLAVEIDGAGFVPRDTLETHLLK